MNYSEILLNFWEKTENQRITSSAIAIYHFLLFKKSKSSSNQIKISDNVMSGILSLSRPTISESRRKLQELGLIKYQSKKKRATIYTLIYQDEISNATTQEFLENDVETKTLIPPQKPAKAIKPKQLSSQEPKESFLNLEKNINKNIPKWDIFLEYSQSLPEFKIELETKIREKYDSWVKSNWTNSLGRPITDWKTVLKKAMPFIKNNESSLASKIPDIKRPKINSQNE